MRKDDDVKNIISRKWSARARTYDLSPGHGIHTQMEKDLWLRKLGDSLDNRQGLKILDTGTGTGALALLLAEMGHEVTAIDLSEKMLQIARDKALASHLTISFEVGDAENPPYAPHSFDAIVNRHLLWTLPNPEKAVQAWKKLLKPGGRLIIIDGNFNKAIQRTVLQELWRYLAMPLVACTEFRDPRMRLKDLDDHLPMRQRQRPEADLNMLKTNGFNADYTPLTLPRHLSPLQFLKYGHSSHSKHQFIVRGVNQ